MSSKSAAKLARVRQDRDALFAEGKHYEALQLYKTLVSRSRARKAWLEAAETATDGAKALLQQGQAGSGGELALALVELYAKSGVDCTPDHVRTLLTLSSAFPAGGHEPHIAFLKAAIKWSPQPDLYLALARLYRTQGDYLAAHQHYLRAGGATELSLLSRPADASAPAEAADAAWLAGSEYAEHAQLLQEWSSPSGGGLPTELDLFMARAVLQYMCLNNISGATALLAYCGKNLPSVYGEPLLHFVSFLCESTQRGADAAPLFDLLRHKYALALSRDPALDKYIDKVGEVFFGRQAQKGFMESILGGFGPQQQQPSPSPTAPAASASASAPAASPTAAAAPDVAMATDVD